MNLTPIICFPTPVNGYLTPISQKYTNVLRAVYGVSKLNAATKKAYTLLRGILRKDGFLLMLRNPEEVKL